MQKPNNVHDSAGSLVQHGLQRVLQHLCKPAEKLALHLGGTGHDIVPDHVLLTLHELGQLLPSPKAVRKADLTARQPKLIQEVLKLRLHDFHHILLHEPRHFHHNLLIEPLQAQKVAPSPQVHHDVHQLTPVKDLLHRDGALGAFAAEGRGDVGGAVLLGLEDHGPRKRHQRRGNSGPRQRAHVQIQRILLHHHVLSEPLQIIDPVPVQVQPRPLPLGEAPELPADVRRPEVADPTEGEVVVQHDQIVQGAAHQGGGALEQAVQGGAVQESCGEIGPEGLDGLQLVL
mmetsp:Transcript_18147/g.46457  ORF Transcript_18147/g.46457 Transcript_18147/m.46457 type:complete len:287 (-) Transcript_18147:994-1854(-)